MGALSDYIYFLALMVLYFLIVYLFAIRKGGQRALPWVILILIQTASICFFKKIRVFAGQLPLPAELLTEPQITMVTAAGLFVINLVLIFLVNLLFNRSEGNQTGEKKAADAAEASSEKQIPVISVAEQVSSELDTEQTLAKAKELLNAGETEAAGRYLKMVAFFESDGPAVQEAKELLNKLNESK